MKVYEKSKCSLEDVGIKLSIAYDDKVLDIVDEVERKVQAMEIVIKSYKKMVCKAEQELRVPKDRVYHYWILIRFVCFCVSRQPSISAYIYVYIYIYIYVC